MKGETLQQAETDKSRQDIFQYMTELVLKAIQVYNKPIELDDNKQPVMSL